MVSSLHESFKSIVLKWTILMLARSYICCPSGVQRVVEQLSSFLLDICCFSCIHMMSLNYCYIPANQIIPGCKIYFNRCNTKKSFSSIFSGTVCLAFLHNDGHSNDEIQLMKYIKKALNTLLANFLTDVAAESGEKPVSHGKGMAAP